MEQPDGSASSTSRTRNAGTDSPGSDLRPIPAGFPHPEARCGQCRPRQAVARRPRTAPDGGAGATAGSISTVSVLWRSHGRHRDHPGRRPAARPASLTRVHRNDGVVTRRGDPQSLVEAVPLRLSSDCMSKPIANSAAARARTKSACLAPEQRPTGALAAPPRRPASNASGRGRPASDCPRRRAIHKSP